MIALGARRAGLTIVELLVAAAVFGVILTLLGSMFVSSRRAYTTSETISEARQAIQSGVQLLAYDIGLAGYRGTDGNPADLSTTRPFADLPLEVGDGAGTAPDTIRVQFYEDRFVGSPVLRNVAYTVLAGNLVRQFDNGDPEVVVEGVTDFQVISWLNLAGTEFVVLRASPGAARPAPANLAGVGLELRLANQNEPETVFIALLNPQCQNLPC